LRYLVSCAVIESHSGNAYVAVDAERDLAVGTNEVLTRDDLPSARVGIRKRGFDFGDSADGSQIAGEFRAGLVEAQAGDTERAVNRAEVDRPVGLHAIKAVDQVIIGEAREPGRRIRIRGRPGGFGREVRSNRQILARPDRIVRTADIVRHFDQEHIGRLDPVVRNHRLLQLARHVRTGRVRERIKVMLERSGAANGSERPAHERQADQIPEGGNRLHCCLVLELCAPRPPAKCGAANLTSGVRIEKL
jgi:hypothetical protein